MTGRSDPEAAGLLDVRAGGPKFSKEDRKAANLERSYFVHQVEYCRNFIFKKNHPIRKNYLREVASWGYGG